MSVSCGVAPLVTRQRASVHVTVTNPLIYCNIWHSTTRLRPPSSTTMARHVNPMCTYTRPSTCRISNRTMSRALTAAGRHLGSAIPTGGSISSSGSATERSSPRRSACDPHHRLVGSGPALSNFAPMARFASGQSGTRGPPARASTWTGLEPACTLSRPPAS